MLKSGNRLARHEFLCTKICDTNCTVCRSWKIKMIPYKTQFIHSEEDLVFLLMLFVASKKHVCCQIGLVASCHSFCIFYFSVTIHTFIQSFTHNNRWGPSPYLHSCRLSGRNLPGVPSRDSNSLSCAAPLHWAALHPSWAALHPKLSCAAP